MIPFFLFLNLSLFGQVTCSTKPYNFTGFCFDYYQNGKIAYIKEFKNDDAIGIWMKFDEKGNLISQLNTRDKKDSLVLIYPLYQEIEINEEELIDYGDDADPKFPGGHEEMKRFLTENFVYPESAIDLGLQGKVYITFTVESNGKMTGIRVIRGVPDCPECDKEVIRLFKLMPNWIPAVENRKRVKRNMQIPFNFILQ